MFFIIHKTIPSSISSSGLSAFPPRSLSAFFIFQSVDLDFALTNADRSEATDTARIAQQFTLDRDAFCAIFVDNVFWSTVAERGVDIIIPKGEGFKDMTVGVDGLVGPCHRNGLLSWQLSKYDSVSSSVLRIGDIGEEIQEGP